MKREVNNSKEEVLTVYHLEEGSEVNQSRHGTLASMGKSWYKIRSFDEL